MIGKPDWTNMSFLLTFLGLTGTIVFTAFGAFDKFNEKEKHLRSALITETAVNIIAGVTYTYMIQYLNQKTKVPGEITSIRYLDWLLTTPFLILSFMFYSNYVENKHNKDDEKLVKVNYTPLAWIIPLNIIMLVFGFLGEEKQISNTYALVGGFLAFAGLFYAIWDAYVKDKPSEMSSIYTPFLIVWLLYGGAFLLKGAPKEISYNFLDLISKTGFGIFLWANNVDRENNTCNRECEGK